MTIEYTVKTGRPEKQRTGCIILPVFKDGVLSEIAEAFNNLTDNSLSSFIKTGDFTADSGDVVCLYRIEQAACERVMLVGMGEQDKLGFRNFKKAAAAAAKKLDQLGSADAANYLATVASDNLTTAQMVRELVISTEDCLYRYDEYQTSKEKKKRRLKKMALYVNQRKETGQAEKAMLQGVAIATGMDLAKDLGNCPPNICNPSYLARQARKLARQHRKLKVDIIDEKQMEKLGMGAFYAVTKGSKEPGKLITMEYNGSSRKSSRPLVLVGKGVTFDSGGISIKPSAKMDEMKYDMGGAASVFGVLAACLQMQLPVHVVGVIAAAENMPGGSASRPGDIVKTLSGQTVEILNTDAEGRLVLCDALTHAAKFKPEKVIDIATLTGACIVALGHHASGMLCNDRDLGDALIAASTSVDDRIWELPLWEDYAEQLKSNFADMANIGSPGAGTITAASFLSKFTTDYQWAHLDIAGTAWKSNAEKGATGRPVPLLFELILQQNSLA
jgi:leucyl aminopeptidase